MNRILVLEPTTTAWMYASPEWKNSTVDSLGKTFQEFVNALEAAQIEYDLGSEDILRNHGSVKNRSLVVGKRAYDLIVLPQGTENLEGSSVALLAQYLANGGTLLCCGGTPAFVDGKPSDRLATLAAQHRENWIRPVAAGALEAINRLSPPVLLFRDTSGLPSSFPLLYHHRRVLEDSELLFLANTRLEYCSGEILASGRSYDRWDLFTGATARYPSVLEGERITIRFSLPPGGSLLLCLRPVAQSSPAMRSETWADLPPHGKTVVHRVEPNVLTLDYCDLTVGGKTERNLYFYDAQQKTFQHHGLDRNPWDNAVQCKTNIVDRDTFSRESGFDAAFHCTLAGGAKTTSLRAVVERPELFRIAVNGKTVKPLPGKWWLDKAFGLFDIGKFLKEGDNSVSVTSSPFTIHSELEPIYLLGNFSLESGDKGFRILPAEPIRLGAWNEQGMPFYAGGVGYTRAFELGGSQITSSRFVVRLGRWSGVVAGVTVNGREAGTIAFAPYELDVTEAMKSGTNRITVTVYGSLKNTLGPHHNNPPLGRAWPGQFQQGAKEGRPAGSTYSTVGYGLLEDFVLRSVVR